jgi:imidazolonepropionase-like amidohydrolase
MNLRFLLGVALGLSWFALPAGAQNALARPQPILLRDVALGRAAAVSRGSLLIREGRIEAVLSIDVLSPPGVRIIEGTGLIALPAFIDAYSRTGVTTPEPKKDQDVPPDVEANVGIDMRHADRKGIAPAFQAAHTLAIEKGQYEKWQSQGFGAALVAPGGQLLAGTSTVAVLREGAARDLVIVPEVFGHGTLGASGPGYPSTLMGYMAQLRQFLLDAQRQVELERRWRDGRPGLRPPFDRELAAAATILNRSRRLVAHAESARDIERWLRLSDEFGFEIAISGGGEAWKVAEVLASRGVPILLTLDWGEEVKDPHSSKQEEAKPGMEATKAAETAATQDRPAQEPQDPQPKQEFAVVADAAPQTTATTGVEEANYTYEEPLEVRVERRRLWLERRDNALRLHEAGVRFAFGTGLSKPDELLSRIRSLIDAGLPADVALGALTREAADLVGLSRRLGRIEPGCDATLVLWRTDPLVDKKAKPAWVFVDGFPAEYELEPEESKEDQAEGVVVDGTWDVTIEMEEGDEPLAATFELRLAEDGSVTGTMRFKSPMDGSEVSAELEGTLSGKELELESTVEMTGLELEVFFTAAIEGDSMTGTSRAVVPGADEAQSSSFRATRKPQERLVP